MPGGDGTGPLGLGPMTGRGQGCCAGYVESDGRVRFVWPPGAEAADRAARQAELRILAAEAQNVQRTVDEVRRRLRRIERRRDGGRAERTAGMV